MPLENVLVPVLVILSQGLLPFIRFGEMNPGSVDVALHGVAMAAYESAGVSKSAATNRNALSLETIDIEAWGLVQHYIRGAGPVHRTVCRYFIHKVPVIEHDYRRCCGEYEGPV